MGGQILLSPYTYERLKDVAEVAPPLPVQFKGIKDPLLLYELQGLGPPYDLRLPEAAGPAGADVAARLPLRAWVIEGKTIGGQAVPGEVVALGPRRLDARRGACRQEEDPRRGDLHEERAHGGWLPSPAV